MCVTAVIAGASLLMSAVGTVASVSANNAQAKYARWEAKEQTKQIKIETEVARISAMERESQRAREFSHSWSTSMAAIGAMGVAEHISFFQGIMPDSMEQLDRDTRAIRLGMANQQESAFKQIGVVGYRSQLAGFNAKMENVGAVAGFMQDAMNAYSFYSNYNVPGGGSKGGGSSSMGSGGISSAGGHSYSGGWAPS
jgi:hypothetical protein